MGIGFQMASFLNGTEGRVWRYIMKAEFKILNRSDDERLLLKAPEVIITNHEKYPDFCNIIIGSDVITLKTQDVVNAAWAIDNISWK